jgi:hypothetical protein
MMALGFWAAFQIVIITVFAALGLLAGGAMAPGNVLAEGAVMLPCIWAGFVISKGATRLLSKAVDRFGSDGAHRLNCFW